VIVVPEQYVVEKLYENIYKIKYNKFNNTYNGCCPICKEGDSWGKKKRFYYMPNKELAYCHNCGYSKKPLALVSDLTNKPLQFIINEIKNYDVEIQIQPEAPVEEKKVVNKDLPTDCINLFDINQVNYYKDNNVVKAAIHLIKERKLDTAVNRPKALYISLVDKVHKDRLILPFYDNVQNIIYYQSRGLIKRDLYTKPKYLSKVNADRSLYGIHSIDPEIENIFIFEGPIDSYFCKNGIATCGITEKTKKIFTVFQKEQINNFKLHNKIYVLDNQFCDTASLNKSFILADNNEKIFIWPEQLKKYKDFNELCIASNKTEINHDFILKNTYHGLTAKLLLTKIKNS